MDVRYKHHMSILERTHADSYRDVINMTIDDETNGTDTGSVMTSLVVTDSIKRWAQQQASSSLTSSMTAAGGNHVFQIRIASTLDDVTADVSSEISEMPQDSPEPLLVVFSNDRKRRKTNERELHEMENHELEAAIELEKVDGNDEEEDKDEFDEEEDKDEFDEEEDKEEFDEEEDKDEFDEEEDKDEFDEEELEQNEDGTDNALEEAGEDRLLRIIELASRTTRSLSSDKKRLRRFVADEQRVAPSTKASLNDSGSRSATLKPGFSPSSSLSSSRRSSTVHLDRKRRKSPSGSGSQRSAARNSCRRRPMYVDFSDIHWDNWIIAPKGYQVRY